MVIQHESNRLQRIAESNAAYDDPLLMSMQSCTTCFYKSDVLQQFSTFQAHVKDREGVYVKNVVHKELLYSMLR